MSLEVPPPLEVGEILAVYDNEAKEWTALRVRSILVCHNPTSIARLDPYVAVGFEETPMVINYSLYCNLNWIIRIL